MNHISVKSSSQDMSRVESLLQEKGISFEGLINGSLPLFSSTSLNAAEVKALLDQSDHRNCVVKDEFGFERNTISC
jgi:hypothetical protein